MADNENIYVNFDYNNIFVVDPNKVIDRDNVVRDRNLKHEELAIYVNLSCKSVPRSKLVIGASNETIIEEINIAEVNFTKPDNKSFLDTSWTDFANEFTVSESKKLKKDLTTLDNIVGNNLNPDTKNRDTPLLGILSININVGTSTFADVRIELEDIRGRALFEQGQNSPYAAFFNYPYPIFVLTFKGYLGKSMKYELQLIDFNARFNGQSGNFLITLKLNTYKFSIFSEIQTFVLFAVPYMYKTTYVIGETTNQDNQVQAAISQTSSSDTPTTNAKTVTTSKGRQKITEVYSDYKSKGLIDENFPDITFPEFLEKLQKIEQTIEDNFNKVEMSVLSDLEVYSKNFTEMIQAVESGTNSWRERWLDQKNYFVTTQNSDYKGAIIYTLKKEKSDSQSAEDARLELVKILTEYNAKLNENPTCGQNGKYTVGGQTKESPIVAEFSYDKIFTELQISDIDWVATYKQQVGGNSENPADVSKFTDTISQTIFNTNFVEQNGQTKPKTYFYTFRTKGGFSDQKNENLKKYEKIKQEIEEEFTKILADKLQNPNENGLGFIPTIRNVFAVFMSSVEAYLRLLDDVHRDAWELRKNDIRKSIIIPESPDYLGDKYSQDYPIYPWPSYIVETTDKTSKFQNRYPGEPDFINKTEAFRYDVWPEVEFVEELFRALTEKDPTKADFAQPSNSLQNPNRISLNIIEFPITNGVYSNLQISKYFYEIWERTFVAAFYQRLNRGNGNHQEIFDIVADAESDNILTSLGTTNPSLLEILKRYAFNYDNIKDVLYHYSNDGTGEGWQLFIRNNFITPLLRNRITNQFVVFSNNQINDERTVPSKNIKNLEKVKTLLLSTTANEIEFTDTYPFTNTIWLRQNVQNGVSIDNRFFNNTSKVIEFNDDKKAFANFQKSTDTKVKRPITHFNYVSPNSIYSQYLKSYYTDLKISEQYPTVGTIKYTSYNAELIAQQATSILNTPYFINSILSGVTLFQSFNQNPFTVPAYLFLNSLPLITLREKYKTEDDSGTNYLDYMSATLRKFAALHKLPYAWVLKYGSIWWRYKAWIESNKTIDPISGVWQSIDPTFNYDPVNSDQTKAYTFNIPYPDGSVSATTVTLQDDYINTVNSVRHTTICSGFYPNVINQFNLFLQGLYVFNFSYTNADIQSGIDNYKLYVIPGTNTSNLYYGENLTSNPNNRFDILFTASTYTGRTLSYKTYSSYIEDIKDNKNVFILPSFGSNVNQCQQECFSYLNDYATMKTELANNLSLFDGSVRCFWNAPHFGYFDNSRVSIPKPNEYLKQIYYNQDEQENFSIVYNGYTDISEIFSVFDKEMLDLFEQEFLKFSKSAYDFTSPDGLLPSEKTYYNFQLLMRELMKVPKPIGENFESIINELQGYQLKTVANIIQGFLEHDILIKHGNPSKFDRKMFYSLSPTKFMEDKFQYNSYFGNSPNAVPYGSSSVTTLAVSQLTYPAEWNAIELNIGFSNIPQLQYKDTGSYITDFFVEMNVEFTVNNIINFTDIIKIYASQKLLNPSVTGNTFSEKLDEYLTKNEEFHKNIINSLFTKLQTKIPPVTVTETKKPPAVDGNLSKIDTYYGLKALNDKWISGNDVSFRTYLEDFLFLDNANRDIGNVVVLDIYDMANTKKYYESQKTINNMIGTMASILKAPPQMQPGYINYYGVTEAVKNALPKPYGSLELANVLFGTHLTVDYSLSTPKWIFYLPPSSSENLKMPDNKDVPYGDDGIFLEKTNNPAVEDQTEKKDWAFSNRVIGFNVNFGTQNQNVFTNLSIDMNTNKASLASMQAQVDMATNSFKKTSSQNLGLLNFYQKRSYTCEISMLGNALIQPGMYFNLTNVPLFAGSYKIDSVSHVIAPGTFETRFTGMRQKIYSYPLQADYLQSINKSVLKKVQSKLPKAQSTSDSQPTNVIAQTNEKVQNAKDEKVAPEVQNCSPTTPYERYATVDPVMSKYSYTQMIDLITNEVVNAPTQVETIKKVMFVIIFIESSDSSGNELISYNNNFAGVRLVKNWGQVGETYFDTGKYVCLQGINDQISVPYAVFKSINDNIKFLYENIRGRVATMVGTSIQDFSQIYVDYWQKIQNVYESMTVQQREVIDNKTKTALALLAPIDKPAEPSPLIAIYNYTTPLDGDREFKDITIYLDPSVDGDRKIFLVDFDVSTPSKETDCFGSGSRIRFEDDGAKYFGKYNKEYVAFIVDRNDLLREIDCDSASAQRDGYNNVGVYNFLINLYTKPILPNGSLDTSRSDVYEGFPVTIEVKQL